MQDTESPMSNNLQSLFACDVSLCKHFLTFSTNTTSLTNLKFKLFIDIFFICCNLSKLNSKQSIGCGLYRPHRICQFGILRERYTTA